LLETNLTGSASFYTEYKQLIIRAHMLPLPLLGVGGLLAALAVLYFGRRDKLTAWMTSAAILFVIIGMVITLTIHFPSNDQILTWSPEAPPADWEQLRDRWRNANTVRSVAAIIAFVLLEVPMVSKRTIPILSPTTS
jgi:uncharacterized membrane protein